MKIEYDTFIKNINNLTKDYRLYGPVRHKGAGRYSDTDLIYYEIKDDFRDFDFSKKSDFSPKEILTPNNQTMFTFENNQIKEASISQKPIIVFLRSCDMHGVKKLDEIYLNNKYQDFYYKRLRNLVNFAVIGCNEEFDNCFCTTFNTNKTEDYQIGINIDTDNQNMVNINIKDQKFKSLGGIDKDFVLDHVLENKNKVNLPKFVDLKDVIHLDIWDEYNTRCVGCGSCNFVCPTCSCFTTQDIKDTKDENKGSRKRVLASCMTPNFSTMAGGHSFRNTNGEKMRFKLMHKIIDFKKKFGEEMCVGCGRCDIACPEMISFSNQINKLTNAVGGQDE